MWGVWLGSRPTSSSLKSVCRAGKELRLWQKCRRSRRRHRVGFGRWEAVSVAKKGEIAVWMVKWWHAHSQNDVKREWVFIAIYARCRWRRPLQRNYNAQFALYGIDVQRSPLVDNHIMCAVDVDVDVDGLSRVMTDRDTRLINGCGPPPENVRSFGRNVRWRGHSSDDSLSLRGRSFSLLMNCLVTVQCNLEFIFYLINSKDTVLNSEDKWVS